MASFASRQYPSDPSYQEDLGNEMIGFLLNRRLKDKIKVRHLDWKDWNRTNRMRLKLSTTGVDDCDVFNWFFSHLRSWQQRPIHLTKQNSPLRMILILAPSLLTITPNLDLTSFLMSVTINSVKSGLTTRHRLHLLDLSPANNVPLRSEQIIHSTERLQTIPEKMAVH